jgi:ribose transport system ATP-binding protein
MFLQMNNIVKTFPGVIALDDVTLHVKKGEVHALIGENGAGKSTLIKTCSGAHAPDKGNIVIDGQKFQALTPKLSKELGIAIIYQEFDLVGELSVAENVFLGRALRKGIFIDRKAMVKESEKIFEQFNIEIDPNELVKNLTVGYQQIVEIAKAISQDAKILIMDEPSAPLTQSEAEQMYRIVDNLKASGVTIIYISHRLEEIFRLSDRVTVLRDGKLIKTMDTKDANISELIRLMVGRELTETYPSRGSVEYDDVILEVENLSGNGLTDISFKVMHGEVLGFGGLIGAGRTELAELIFGYKPKTGGKIIYKGKEISPKHPEDVIKHGIALVPEDRKKHGVFLKLDIRNNISMPILSRISKASVVDKEEERRIAMHYKDAIDIRTPSLEQFAQNLSGGNQQKVVIAKWLASEADLYIFDEPTRGIDVGAKYEIYKIVNSLVESGKTVMMISSEMEELMGMSDRIIVLSEGKITGMLNKDEFDQESILSLASAVAGKGRE